jgi:hypothetical protein
MATMKHDDVIIKSFTMGGMRRHLCMYLNQRTINQLNCQHLAQMCRQISQTARVPLLETEREYGTCVSSTHRGRGDGVDTPFVSSHYWKVFNSILQSQVRGLIVRMLQSCFVYSCLFTILLFQLFLK